jgi:cytochrome c biogenesis protein CcdA
MDDSPLTSYLAVWGKARTTLEEHTTHGGSLFYSSILFVATLSTLLFVLNIAELATGATVALWVHGLAYLLAGYAGLIGWRYGKL